MITNENITSAMHKYIENFKTIIYEDNNFNQLQEKDKWIVHREELVLSHNALMLENERLLDDNIRPLIHNESIITEEQAELFIRLLEEFYQQNIVDTYLYIDIYEGLLRFFNKEQLAGKDEVLTKKQEKYISRSIYCHYKLASLYSNINCESSIQESLSHSDAILQYQQKYPSINNIESRLNILYSYYNMSIIGAQLDEPDWKKVIGYLRIVEALVEEGQLTKEELDDLEQKTFFTRYYESLAYISLIKMDDDKRLSEPAIRDSIFSIEDKLYRETLKRNGESIDSNPFLFYMHNTVLLYKGKITEDEYFNVLYSYYNAFDKISKYEASSPEFMDLVEIVTDYSSKLVRHIWSTSKPEHEKYRITADISENLLTFIRRIPKGTNNNYFIFLIFRTIINMSPYLYDTDTLSNLLLETTLYQHSSSLIHCLMVQRISKAIIESVISKRPQLLIGTFDIKSDSEVQEKMSDIRYFVRQAAIWHDIGKNAVVDIVDCTARKLTKNEFDMIRQHPYIGGRLVEKIGREFFKYYDIILGHHKSYDGKSGYPIAYDNTASKYRFITDIITIADSTDAATDSLGRSYAIGKSFDEVLGEFTEAAGTLYNPDIVKLICDDKQLKDNIVSLTTEGRRKLCQKIQKEYMMDRGKSVR